jgi:hypothetical protein
MTLATKSDGLILKDGKIATNCNCCGDFCCTTGTLAPLIEFTISGFTSSRGEFIDFNPNRTYLLPTPGIVPDPFYNPIVSAPTCAIYSSFELSYDQALFNVSSQATCSIKSPSAIQPVWTLLWQLQAGRTTGNIASGCFDINGILCVSMVLQSRTSELANEMTIVVTSNAQVVGDLPLSIGLTREQFINAVCARSLNISGSHSGIHHRPNPIGFAPSDRCANAANIGSYSFDWTLRVSDLP